MSQPTHVDSARRVPGAKILRRATRPRFLGIIAAAAVLLTSALAASPAQASALASGTFHAFSSTDWQGPDRYFSGNLGECHYVGANWNDRIRSARTENSHTVELWDNANCTGGAIVIDRSGYHAIGAWVSAYKVVS
ncbi:peptidase inhibitor family I36 protein [Mangrovihabitans endophyticus]|nr:peptidase inhibitor family I36 protein [Mangrovihabitans endophyticus]